MKKRSILVTATLLFAAFTLGFFLGRNQGRTPPRLSLPEAMAAAPTEALPQLPFPEVTEAVAFPIDLNTATEEMLTALPGIGPVLARRILSYRAEHGDFAAPEELMNVPGIGEGRMDAIWDYVTIGGNP